MGFHVIQLELREKFLFKKYGDKIFRKDCKAK